MDTPAQNKSLQRVVAFVGLLNVTYFGVEFAVAVAIGSVSLFADSIDFLEDTSLNLLVFVDLSWSAQTRARLGMLLAAVLLVPGIATLWTAWLKFTAPIVPAPIPTKTDDQVGPSRIRVARRNTSRDDRDICERIVASRKERCACEATTMITDARPN